MILKICEIVAKYMPIQLVIYLASLFKKIAGYCLFPSARMYDVCAILMLSLAINMITSAFDYRYMVVSVLSGILLVSSGVSFSCLKDIRNAIEVAVQSLEVLDLQASANSLENGKTGPTKRPHRVYLRDEIKTQCDKDECVCNVLFHSMLAFVTAFIGVLISANVLFSSSKTDSVESLLDARQSESFRIISRLDEVNDRIIAHSKDFHSATAMTMESNVNILLNSDRVMADICALISDSHQEVMGAVLGNSIFTSAEASAYLKVSIPTLEVLAQSGIVQGIKIGDQWRFHRDCIDEYVKSQGRSFPMKPEGFPGQ